MLLNGRKKEKRQREKFKKLKKPEICNAPAPKATRNFVTNLSDEILSNDEISLLNKGLKYKPPIDPSFSKTEIIINIESKIDWKNLKK